MSKRTPKVKQPQTYEEWLAWEYSNWPSQHGDMAISGNPTYAYKVKEAVILGNLKDCVIEEILDGGMRYVMSYTDKGQRYPRIVWWTELCPKALVEDTAFARPRINATYRQTSLDSVILQMYRRGYIDNPDYQRDYVWTLADKQRLIRSIFNRMDIGKFAFVEYMWPENRIEIVDGKQRLSAIREFIEGRFEFEGKSWYQISHKDKNAFEEAMVHVVVLDAKYVTKADILWLFLAVNEAGVPQTPEHVAKARKLYEQAAREGTPAESE